MGHLLSSHSLLVVIATAMVSLTLWLGLRSRGGNASGPFAGLPGCGPGSPCDEVLASRWSRLGPLPVALPGTLLYLALLASALLAHPMLDWRHAALAGRAATVLALTAGAAAVWFIALQALVLRRICPYCTAVHALALASATVAAAGTSGSWSAGDLAVPPAALAALIAAQVAVRPRTYAIEHLVREDEPGQATGRHAAADDTVREDELRPSPPRYLSLAAGKVKLSTADTPRVGPAGARRSLALLFDYTCATCRHVHELVLRAMDAVPGGLAVYLLPLPLEPACNPTVTRPEPEHEGACRYARLMLGLWRAAPQRLEEYERWFASFKEQPTLEACRELVRAMLGEGEDPYRDPSFAAALITDAVDTYRGSGVGKVPAVLLPYAVLGGRVETLEELLAAIEKGMEPAARCRL